MMGRPDEEGVKGWLNGTDGRFSFIEVFRNKSRRINSNVILIITP